ncbi:SDR family NAD(P)-dependent oxidoreductase [Streptomyces sp. RGM 3693]|uniref:SDR family NAD(P)-dependent oxidoreductase n=1 Tax=Streptomyces sp. RGM 3693 TaxID=3413284 RepID=UPI003D2B84D5
MRQTVVITGASGGIGLATARASAVRGARIGLPGCGRKGLEAAAREVVAVGGEALVLTTDVANPAALEPAADAVEAASDRSTYGSTMPSPPPCHPQPVPPIYQPEVAARAILYVADHPRRKQYRLNSRRPVVSSRRRLRSSLGAGTRRSGGAGTGSSSAFV